jgi:hypothetical protein
VLATLALALRSEPIVAMQPMPEPADVARALSLVQAHDPRRAQPGAVSALRLNERELDLLLNHAGARWLDASVQVSLERRAASVRGSLHLPPNPFGRWLNVQARWLETGGLPVLDSLQIGGLPLPAWLGERVALALAERAGLLGELQFAAGVVRRVTFAPQQMGVIYAWSNDSADRMLAALLPLADQERLHAHGQYLSQLVERQGPGWQVSLAPLLGPMFELARQRSAAGGDAATENRAALVVLTFFVNGRPLNPLLPRTQPLPRPRFVQVTLAGRDDFPRHLLISAALAAEGTSPLSKAIGTYKEVADSRGGTGFSFNDMAANRAGTRLGELAVRAPEKLQAVLAAGVQESDVMPAWADLPSGMSEAEFKQRFGGVGTPVYLGMMAEIERRVGALPALR